MKSHTMKHVWTRAALLVLLGSAFAFGFAVTTNVASANSTVVESLYEYFSPGKKDFTGDEHGFISAYAGKVWVTGVGSMYDTEVDDADQDRESNATYRYIGTINTDIGRWKLVNANYAGEVVAKAHYVGGLMTQEDYHVTAQGTSEIYGDFNWLEEARCMVYSVGSHGSYNYDVDGEGGDAYVDAGTQLANFDGVHSPTVTTLTFGDPQNTFVRDGLGIVIYLRAAGYQRIFNDAEEDVSLNSQIKANGTDAEGNIVGWSGQLEAYDINYTTGEETLLGVHPIPKS